MTVQQTSHAYVAFGLEITSDLPMPELAPGTGGDADLTIVEGRVGGELADAERPVKFGFRESDGGQRDLMSWHDVADFEIVGDDRIIYSGAPDSGDALVSLPMLGPVMAVLLHRRGYLTLHGSAVTIDGRAAVFLGDKGAGKSTTAAALVQAGHALVTDDIVAITLDPNGPPQIWPGYPQVKLTDSATEALPLAGSETMPSPHPDFGKHRHLLSGTFDSGPAELSEAIVLVRGDRLEVESLRGIEAVQALMRFSYIVRFADRILTAPAQADHLRQCAGVANAAAVCRITVPHDLTRLADIADAIRRFRAERNKA